METTEENHIYCNNSSSYAGQSSKKSRKESRHTTFTPQTQSNFNKEFDTPVEIRMPSSSCHNSKKDFNHNVKRVKSQICLIDEAFEELLLNVKTGCELDNDSDHNRKPNNRQVTSLSLSNLTSFYSNTEIISNFYEYTENCMRLIVKLAKNKRYQGGKAFFGFNMKEKKRIVALDLDETLIHCTSGKEKKGKHLIDVKLPGNKNTTIAINIRPYWKKMIKIIREKYHIVIYTASHKVYADAVLDYMDPCNKYFPHRLYRSHCVHEEIDKHKFYIKDMEIFAEADLKDIIIVDNSVLSFSYHINNGIPIIPFYNDVKDIEMLLLAYYLISITSSPDLRDANSKNIQLNYFFDKAKDDYEEEQIMDEEPEEKIDDNQIFIRSNSRVKTPIGIDFQDLLTNLRHNIAIKNKETSNITIDCL